MSLSHTDTSGRAQMVDVSAKAVTTRRAVARGFVRGSPGLITAIRDNQIKKGNLLDVARLAGIIGAKKTSELIPLCHQIALSHIAVEAALTDAGVELQASVATSAQTGVEMEALTAVAIAALTVIDMGKAIDKTMVIERIELLEKTGGKADYRRETK